MAGTWFGHPMPNGGDLSPSGNRKGEADPRRRIGKVGERTEKHCAVSRADAH
jgi:hypothetical protein